MSIWFVSFFDKLSYVVSSSLDSRSFVTPGVGVASCLCSSNDFRCVVCSSIDWRLGESDLVQGCCFGAVESVSNNGTEKKISIHDRSNEV